jgi:hypothetical protein
MPEREDAYEPTSVEVERNIQQGGGVGAKDLARQAEPSVVVAEDADEECGGRGNRPGASARVILADNTKPVSSRKPRAAAPGSRLSASLRPG